MNEIEERVSPKPETDPTPMPSVTILRGAFTISAGMLLMCVKGALGWGWFLLALFLFLVGFFFPRRE